MTEPNPYLPPQAALAGGHAAPDRQLAYILAGLVAVHALLTWRDAGMFFQLVRTGAMPAWTLLLTASGSLFLYGATIRMLLAGRNGKWLFALAAIGLGGVFLYFRKFIYLPDFELMPILFFRAISQFSLVPMYGAALSLAGWWMVRRNARTAASPQS